MGTPYVGEIRMFAGNFAPAGWALCSGQMLPISENDVLFQLIGTMYGGDGVNYFNLPNLASRLPMHQGTNAGQTFVIGEAAGVESVTLTTAQIPSHAHVPQAQSGAGTQASPTAGIWAASAAAQFSSAAPNVTMDGAAIGAAGGSQPHDNMMPFLVINFIISLFGVFPTPT